MTEIGKLNAMRLIEGSTIFSPDPNHVIENYVLSLIREDIMNDKSCLTLEEAIAKYGEALWYDEEIPKEALGEIIDNCSPYRVAALKVSPVYKYIFQPQYTYRHS